MEFRKILKEKRKELSLTQEQLAKELNVSRSAISNWEIGRNYPDIETLILLANLFQVPLDYLLNEDVRVIEAVDLDLSKKKKLKRMTVVLAGFLLLSISLIFFLILPKAPKIELVEESVPENSEVVFFRKNEFQKITIENKQLEIVFDGPKKAVGYYMEHFDGELSIQFYKVRMEEEAQENGPIPYQTLLQLDLSSYEKLKNIQVTYGNY